MFLLLACLTSPAEYEALLADAQDADGDGFAAVEYGGEDCDDADAAVSPEAEDTCDSRDNDCDGSVDEGIVIPIWYPDQDGDRFGVSEEGIAACFRPEGTVPEPGDCDDQDTKKNPAADEICDGQDNDCDGLVDDADTLAEVPGQTWFPDGDGDGYAADDAVAEGFCSAPAGYVEALGDCDDSSKSVNPAATEVCEDGIDNDCSGDAPECGFEGAYTLNRADLVLKPGGVDFGSSFALVDVGEAEPWLFVGTSNKVFGFEPPFDGSEEIESWDVRLKGDGTGHLVVALGDVDNDGTHDVVSSNYDARIVQVFEGTSAHWTERATVQSSETGVDVFGLELGRYQDAGLLLGQLDGYVSDGSIVLEGTVFLFDEIPEGSVTELDADASIVGDEDDALGYVRTTLAVDLDGDGAEDLLIGSVFNSEAVLFFGGVSGTTHVDSADSVIVGPEFSGLGGAPVSSDLDGDGYQELLLSGIGYSGDFEASGAVWAFQGGSTWASELQVEQAAFSVVASEADAGLGRGIQIGDFNADDEVDLATSELETGDVYLFEGPLLGQQLNTDDNNAILIAFGGGDCSDELVVVDANLDGFDDVVTGCPDAGTGSAHVLLSPGL